MLDAINGIPSKPSQSNALFDNYEVLILFKWDSDPKKRKEGTQG